MSTETPMPAEADKEAHALTVGDVPDVSSPTAGGFPPHSEPPASFVQKERVPPLRADDSRVLTRLRNGKRAWVYPGQVRVSSGHTYGWKAAEVPAAPIVPQPAPKREYRVAASNRALGKWNVLVLRYLYALPPGASLPFISQIAAELCAVKHDLDDSWNALAACGAIRTVYGRPAGMYSGKAWWRVVVLSETGRVLRTVNAPADVTP